MQTTWIGSVFRLSSLPVTIGANLLAQSTLLIAAGLVIARLLRGKGEALRCAILRATLVGVILCPVASLCLSKMRVSGLVLRLPHTTTPQPEISARSPAPEPNPSEMAEFSTLREVLTQPSPAAATRHFGPPPPIEFKQPEDAPLVAPQQPPSPGPEVLTILYVALTALWAMVSGFLLMQLLLAHLRMACVRRLGQDVSVPLTALCRVLARNLHVKAPVLLTSPFVKSPCLIGFLRAAILLPESYSAGEYPALREVLVHELAHLARRDCAWNLIARVARAAMFFQPLLWVLVRRIEGASDDVADDHVVQQGIDRRSYAHELVAIAERYRPSPCEAIAGAGVVSFKSSLGRRVQRILDTTRVLSICIGARAGAAIGALGLCATLAAGLIGAEGGNPADDAANTPINSKVSEASASAPRSIADIKPPFTFRIHTVTPEGKPQSGVRIRCLHPRQERGKALVDVVGESDESGIAEFHVTAGDLTRDRYYWFSLADEQFVGTSGALISPVDDEYEFTFQVAPTEEFKFLVYDENGKTVPDAMLELTTNDSQIHYPRKTTHADHEGQATVRLASAETYIIAMAENYASTFIREAHLSTDKPYEIKLTAGFTITGKVVDHQGAGLSAARIEARKADFPQLCDDESLLRGVTDAGGEFELKHASAGTHEIRAHVDDPNKPLFAEPVSVRVGDDIPRAHLIIQAKPGAVLKGRYVVKRDFGTTNRPIHVYTFKPSYTHWHAQTGADDAFSVHIPSDAEGDIQFLGQPDYFNLVKPMKPHPFLSVQDYYDIRYKHVPPGIYDGIEVHLTSTGVARGAVLDDSGKPLANLAVVVSPHGRILRTGRDGKYWAAVPADEEVWLEVKDSSPLRTLVKTAPFRVREREIVEKNITVPKPSAGAPGWKFEVELPGRGSGKGGNPGRGVQEAPATEDPPKGTNPEIGPDALAVCCVGPKTNPVADARLSTDADGSSEREPEWRFYDIDGRPRKTDSRGMVVFKPQLKADGKALLYARHEALGLVGLLEVSRADLGKARELVLQPECRVRGRIVSSGLKKLGRPMQWTNVYVYAGDYRPLGYESEQQRFEFFLPAGQYKLYAYGTDLEDTERHIEVGPGQRELEIEVDLPPTRLAKLIGKPAPELQKIKGWKNGGPVRLAELKGKYVLLDFWGYWCGPCVRLMPELMLLHEAFGDRGLVIIGVHDDSVGSIEEMDTKLAKVRSELWMGHDIPFLVALDGGGETPIEGSQHKARGATTAAYGIQSFPTKVLVGPDGKVIGMFHAPSPGEYIAKLKELLRVEPAKAEWKERFDSVYRLDEGETLRCIEPPFIPERSEFFFHRVIWTNQILHAPPYVPDGSTFVWDGRQAKTPLGTVATLRDLLWSLGVSPVEIRGPDDLLELKLDGDWIVRESAPVEQRLLALSQILNERYGRSVRFEKRRLEEEVIVASGRFEFRPLPEYGEDRNIRLYADQLDETHGGGSGPVGNLLRYLGYILGQRVIDEIQSSEDLSVSWINYERGSPYTEKDPRRVEAFLENLSKQSSLEFRREKRMVEVWLVDQPQKDQGSNGGR